MRSEAARRHTATPEPGSGAAGLNDNHRRSVLATLGSIDAVLTDVVGLLAAGATRAPLSRTVDDASPVQRRVTLDLVGQLRQQMTSMLAALGLPLPAPTTGAAWAVRTRLLKVGLLLDDLQPARLRGYGALDWEAERALRAEVAGLERLLERLSGFLAQAAGQGYADRLRRLQAAGAEAGLLSRLAEVVEGHGLVEFWPVLAHLVARLRVLVSKCDLLAAAELAQTVSYIGDTLADELGEPVPVHGVSALPSHSGPLDAWFEHDLQPLLEDARRLAEASLQRKTGHLRAVVAAALRRRLGAAEATPAARVAERTWVEARLCDAQQALQAARQACRDVVEGLATAKPDLVQVAVAAALVPSEADPRIVGTEVVQRAVDDVAALRGRAVFSQVRALCDRLQQSLDDLAPSTPLPSLAVDLQADLSLADLPVPELIPRTVAASAVEAARGWRWLGALGRGLARRRLTAAVSAPLEEGLARYAHGLRAWAAARLDRLEALYDGAVAGHRDRLRQGTCPDPTGTVEGEALRTDLQAIEGEALRTDLQSIEGPEAPCPS